MYPLALSNMRMCPLVILLLLLLLLLLHVHAAAALLWRLHRPHHPPAAGQRHM
jgi:hypothetical protein